MLPVWCVVEYCMSDGIPQYLVGLLLFSYSLFSSLSVCSRDGVGMQGWEEGGAGSFHCCVGLGDAMCHTWLPVILASALTCLPWHVYSYRLVKHAFSAYPNFTYHLPFL